MVTSDASNKLKAAIIGLGQVGIRFDLEEERSKNASGVWTHFSAYERLSELYEIVAAVDPEVGAWQPALARKPDLKCFRTTGELVRSDLAIDVASICVPDAMHLTAISEIQEKARGIFLEKPIAMLQETEAAERMIARLKAQDTAVYVNYFKRVEPSVTLMLERLNSNGESIRLLECRYSGPFMAVGSHALDLLSFVLGPFELKHAICHEHQEGAGYSAFALNGKGALANLIWTGPRHDLIFELDVVTDQSRYRLVDNLSGYERAELGQSARYKGYREYFAADARKFETNPERFTSYLRQLHEDVVLGRPRYENLDAAMRSQILMRQIQVMAAR